MRMQLKCNKNGVEVTITVQDDNSLWIQATGKVGKKTMDAVNKLNHLKFDASWAMNQITKTI